MGFERKILKQPVSTLLGGRYREKVQVYATGLYFTESMKDRMCEALAEEALMYKEQGYSAVKMKVGLGIEKISRMCWLLKGNRR